MEDKKQVPTKPLPECSTSSTDNSSARDITDEERAESRKETAAALKLAAQIAKRLGPYEV